jgi:hypothetical protein
MKDNTNIIAPSGIYNDHSASLPQELATENGEVVSATSPESSINTQEGNVTTHTHTKTMNTENNEHAGNLSSGEDTNEAAKTQFDEEKWRAGQLEMEKWREYDGHESRYFMLPDRARSHLLKSGSVGREMLLRGELDDEHSIQVYFGYRRALVAHFWPPGQNNGEDPAGSWELHEYRWKSEEGREVVRLDIDEFLELAEHDYGEIYIDTFFNDSE